MQLVLDTNGISLRVRNRSFLVSAGKERRMISPHRLSSIAVITPCTLTSAAVLLAVEHKIPIIFFDHAGEPEAQVWSTRFGNLADLRRAQVLFGMSETAVQWAAEVFSLKSTGQQYTLTELSARAGGLPLSTDLRKAATDIRDLSSRLSQQITAPEPFVALMGIEGAIARLYWPLLGRAAPAGFNFEKRSRRPAVDAFNAALNYTYGLLYNAIEGAVLAAGMDPMFGIIHADSFGAPTLVFDLIEPFRPPADRFLLNLLYAGTLDLRHVEPWQSGIGLSREGRKILIASFNDWLSEEALFQDQRATWRNHQFRYAGALANQLKEFWKHDHTGKLRHRKRPATLTDSE